jgi:hypothetical protein
LCEVNAQVYRAADRPEVELPTPPPGPRCIAVLMPVGLGPKHSAFYEAFKCSDDVSDEIRDAIGERHTRRPTGL